MDPAINKVNKTALKWLKYFDNVFEMVLLMCSKQSLMIWFAIDLVYVRENYSRFGIGRGKEYEPEMLV